MKKKKIVLRNNSHSYSDYQSCGMLFNFGFVECLGKSGIHEPYVKGELVHKILGKYDILRHKESQSHADSLAASNKLFTKLVIEEPYVKLKQESKALIYTTYQQYLDFYKNEHRRVLGIEVGFSKILYEDRNFIFVLEGSIDAPVEYPIIGRPNEYERIPFDRKTRSRTEDVYQFSNQFIGYCWAMGANKVLVDYIGYQASLKPKEKFVRKIHPISQAQIEQWKHDTIWWYFQMLASMKSSIYMRNRSSCSGKYGLCFYHEICEAATEGQRNWIKKREFVKVKPHVSW